MPPLPLHCRALRRSVLSWRVRRTNYDDDDDDDDAARLPSSTYVHIRRLEGRLQQGAGSYAAREHTRACRGVGPIRCVCEEGGSCCVRREAAAVAVAAPLCVCVCVWRVVFAPPENFPPPSRRSACQWIHGHASTTHGRRRGPWGRLRGRGGWAMCAHIGNDAPCASSLRMCVVLSDTWFNLRRYHTTETRFACPTPLKPHRRLEPTVEG